MNTIAEKVCQNEKAENVASDMTEVCWTTQEGYSSVNTSE